MSNDKYVGLDVHQASVVAAVLNAQGKCVCQSIVETKGSTIVDFITGLSGTLHVTFEEGTQSVWLYDLIRPWAAELVVCDPRKNRLLVGENKGDRVDANKLAHRLRLGELKPVYKGEAGLRRLKELVHCYDSLVSDTTRVRNRIKAIYRGRGITCAGRAVYHRRRRADYLAQLDLAGAAAARRVALPATRRLDATAAGGRAGDVGREPEAGGHGGAAQCTGDRAGEGGTDSGGGDDASPIPD